MGLISISVLVASVVYVFIRPPPWMPLWFVHWRTGYLATIISRKDSSTPDNSQRLEDTPDVRRLTDGPSETKSKSFANVDSGVKAVSPESDAAIMPPPPLPTMNDVPVLFEPAEEITPKADPSNPSLSVPAFSLDERDSSTSTMPPPPLPLSRTPPSMSMPPPPRPSAAASSSSSKLAGGRVPSLPQFPAANSVQRTRPVPARGPPSASSGLSPPPTITAKPQKPGRKVLLEPGHSPLDWASISGPNADLRGIPPETPYLRVTPSMLKEKTGRRGKDAWMAINGKVYNVTPYAKFHPGGIPELMRGAGRDGTKLFWEIHPWVNYETMLAACLIGLMVEEPEGSGSSKMDEMD